MRHLLFAALGGAILSLAGCTTGASVNPACADLTGLPNPLAVKQSPVKLVPTTSSVSIYPGQSVTVDVAVSSSTVSGPVTISTNALTGLSVTPTTANIGTTVPIQLNSTQLLASGCFTGIQGVVTASLPLQFKTSTGSASEPISLDVQLENPDYLPTTTNLPVMAITTADAAPIDSKDDRVDGTVTITDPNDSSNNYTGTMAIKGHGNSTWLFMPKKPYNMKLDDKAPLLGFNSSKNWILLANYDDKSLVRTDLAFHLGTIFNNLQWTPSAAFVELYLNNQYEGVYQLSEKVEVDKSRLNIGEMDDTDISGDDLTGGYIGEIDQYEGATFVFHTAGGNKLPISLDDPDPPVDVQASYFQDTVNNAVSSLYASNFTDTTAGWPAHFDQASLVDWFLVEELMENQDSNDFSSMYFNKPRSDDRIYMGPIWDLDISSGNDNYGPKSDPTVPWVATQASWYAQLLKDPAFMAAVKTRWTAIRPQLNNIDSYILSRSGTLTQGAQNNYSRWITLHDQVWPNVVALGSYDVEVNYLRAWMQRRLTYMDATYLQQ